MIKITYLILFILALIPSLAFAQNEFKNEWFGCETISDCEWSKGTCSWPIVVNRSYTKEYHSYINSTARRDRCFSLEQCINEDKVENFHLLTQKNLRCENKLCKIRISYEALTNNKFKQTEIDCLRKSKKIEIEG